MVELAATSEDLGLPLETGAARLATLPETPMISVAPFRGQEAAVAALLQAELPVGRAVPTALGRLIWAGLGTWLLRGPVRGDRLDRLAAVTEQSDAWCGLALTGPAATDVLARLVPLDLDPSRFPIGTAARSMLHHVPLLLVAVAGGFEIFVPRSYARTAVHDLATAMAAVAGRAALGAVPRFGAGPSPKA